MHRHSYVFSVALLALGAAGVRANDWPQWGGADREGVWRETGILPKFPPGGPKVLWRTAIGSGYSGPAVAGVKVYVMDRQRAMDKDGKPLRPTRDGIPGKERILCLNAADGKLVWEHVYDCPYRNFEYRSGPRTTPLVHGNDVYTLGAMGDLYCLNKDNGSVRWKKNLLAEYKLDKPPVWGYAAHPVIEGDLLITLVGGPGSAVVALNKNTGAEVWRGLTTEEIGYSPPMVYEAGGKRQLIIWLSESLNSLDPVTGAVYWTQQYPLDMEPQRPAVNIMTVRRQDDLMLISTFYHGPMMLKLAADKPTAEILWKGKSNNPTKPDGIHSVMGSPIIKDGHVYGTCISGELRCLKADTGKQLWETYEVIGGKAADCGTAFLIPQGDRFVIFNDLGELILAELTPSGYKEIDRAKILEPIQEARGRIVVWSHPAFAQKCVFARNDKEIICVSMADVN